MASRARSRVDMAFYTGAVLSSHTRVLVWDPCPVGLPLIWTAGHVRPGSYSGLVSKVVSLGGRI